MPGISLALGDSVPRSVAADALRSLRFTDEYDERTVLSDGSAFLGISGYPDYPVTTVETPRAHLVLEGRLYDADDERRHLREVGAALLDDRDGDVAGWLRERDGDFVILAHEKATGRTRILNDAFARLPLHYATVGDTAVVSRELKFVLALAAARGDSRGLDRMAAAQYLLLGYPLGDRTIYEGVRCVPPGSVVRVDDGFDIRRLYAHDFERTPRSDRGVDDNAAALASLFEEACANRDIEGLPTVVSLSGGLDSRAVGGGYDAAGAEFTAATFEKPGGANAADVAVAERIAAALGADWERYPVERTAAARESLLEMKQGMNFLAMSFILDFFEQLRARHGPLVYVTGDGGDKVLPDATPPRSFGSRRDLAEYVADAHGIFDPGEAAAVAGVDREALVDSIAARLAAYPESDFDAMYVHFLVRERAINWLNHAEDRNRYYFWSVSPFYSLPFFEQAMSVPADQKRHSRLYAAFLDELDPQLTAIENANYGAPVGSLSHTAKQAAVELVTRYPRLKRAVTAALGDGPSDGLAELTADRLRETDARPFADAAVESVVDGQRDGRALYNLLTLVAAADNDVAPSSTADAAPRLVSDGSGAPPSDADR